MLVLEPTPQFRENRVGRAVSAGWTPLLAVWCLPPNSCLSEVVLVSKLWRSACLDTTVRKVASVAPSPNTPTAIRCGCRDLCLVDDASSETKTRMAYSDQRSLLGQAGETGLALIQVEE